MVTEFIFPFLDLVPSFFLCAGRKYWGFIGAGFNFFLSTLDKKFAESVLSTSAFYC